MAVVTVKVHHPHDGCAEGTKNHVGGNPSVPGLAREEARHKSALGKMGMEHVGGVMKKKGNPGKVEATMREFKAGTLHSGSKEGPKVTNPKQAIAIGLSQAREAGEKVAAAPKNR